MSTRRIHNCPAAALLLLLFLPLIASCSDSEPPVRSEKDIMGVWSEKEGEYMYLDTDFSAYTFSFWEEGGEPLFSYAQDGYFYEPGYNFVFYMNEESQPDIYQVIKLTDTELVWCWVDNLFDDKYKGLSKSEIIGKVIQQAQNGEFHPDPARYKYFTRQPFSVIEDNLARFGLTFEDLFG